MRSHFSQKGSWIFRWQKIAGRILPRVQKRKLAASLLLAIMFLNFIGEGGQLFGFVLDRYHLSPVEMIAGIFPAESETASCCSQKPATTGKSCSCPDCGDNCPMGDACTCGTEGHQPASRTGVFFSLPGCHPAESNLDGYLPLSMRVVFLLDACPPCLSTPLCVGQVRVEPQQVLNVTQKPSVPPPRKEAIA